MSMSCKSRRVYASERFCCVAGTHFEQAISVSREIKAENELALAYSGMGRFRKQQGNTGQARDYLRKALEIFERLHLGKNLHSSN